ncbi:MAG: hypothetical protein NT169_01475 [Chloroflexi bacterium]|nr:hypothetical protein [Chloroflexota bacterium]
MRIAEGGQTIRLLRGGSADSHAASSATEHENRGNWIRGFSRSGGQSEKPAEASSPEERATILRAVAHAGRAATADENVPQSAGLRLGRCPRQSGGLRYGAAHLALTGTQGDLLSLLPIGGDAVGVTTAGLAYPLRDETLYFGQARGVSNVFEGAEAEVWLREGMMLVIQTDERRKTDDGGRTTDERRGTNRINEQTD